MLKNNGMKMDSNKSPSMGFTDCRRCGTCCLKGGPALHLEDQPLVDSGKIPLNHLMTFRQGEPILDNVADTIAPAVTDIIRIRGVHENRSDCVFYDRAQKGCRIYDQRPVECEALKCWDTQKIKSIYSSRRLTRRHLISKVQGLWQLVEDHQDHCDYAYIAELVEKIRRVNPVKEAMSELLEIIRYDQHLREVTLERAKLDPGMLLFLFGRPLSFTIKLFEVKMTKTAKGMVIEPVGGTPVCYRRNGFQTQESPIACVAKDSQ
jgi:Fe-S-cluster containining protein